MWSGFSDGNLTYGLFTELFSALPASLQCSILLRVADTATDVLSQCRLFLLVVNRYPSQLSDQGVQDTVSCLMPATHAQETCTGNLCKSSCTRNLHEKI